MGARPDHTRVRWLNAGRRRVRILCLLVCALLAACGTPTPERYSGTPETYPSTPEGGPTRPPLTLPPAASPVPASATPKADSGSLTPVATAAPPTVSRVPTSATPVGDLPTPRPPGDCRLGTGLRGEIAAIVVEYGQGQGMVMAASIALAEITFPKLDGWIRVLGAPSLEELNRKAEEAQERGIPYEALGYGLETSRSTPDAEWHDLVGSTQKARAVADRYGKLLVMGPGFRLMADNWDAYPAMASLADIWLLQTQQLQKEPPGPVYRQQVERVVNQIRSGHPGIPIWAQITLLPDRPPDADEWLAYEAAIADLVEGRTYVAAYTWDAADPAQLVATINAVFHAVCGEEP